MPADYNKIREDNIREYGQGTRHLSFLGRLYTDRTHFVFELLQNAEDAGATRILFNLFEDRLEVTHNGRLFDEKDVRGVCGVGEGTKAEDLTQIGKFGIGFKSVYAYTTAPEIYSGSESFRIEHYVRPFAISTKPTGNSNDTLFIFPFDAENVRETACEEIGECLCNLSARTLLFLRKIEEIEYRLPDSTGGTYLRDEIVRGSARQVSVIGQSNGEEKETEENWLIFERAVPVPGKSEKVRVEAGFLLKTVDKDGKKQEYIDNVDDSPLVVYFPTEKETRLGFIIQGPYRTTPSRDNIPRDEQWNKTLVRETAELAREILCEIKTLGLFSVSFLETLPIRAIDFPESSMFFPIFESIRETLTEKELLPANNGSFVSARNAKLARGADLRKLLSYEQLRQLFQTSATVKWLSRGITQDRTPDLHSYLKNELGIDEVTPGDFAKELNDSFLVDQSDEWFINFYGYLADKTELWRPPYYWEHDSGGILRKQSIIRLNDGTIARPFREDGITPNVYLSDGDVETSLSIIKIDIIQDKKARDFLKNKLGLPEVDYIEEVIGHILPKYKNNKSAVSTKQHVNDIAAIEKAYATDSHEKKQRLKESLRDTPFILTERRQDGKAIYKKPGEVYFANDELRMYFDGNESIYFVDSRYSESICVIMKDLGVYDEIRVTVSESHKTIYFGQTFCGGYYGYTWGVDGFDPFIKIDGLQYALFQPSEEKSRIIWNKLCVPYRRYIEGKLLIGAIQKYDPSRYNEIITKSQNFGELLSNTEWLPTKQGEFKKPCDIEFDELPDGFTRDEGLANQIMKRNVIKERAELAAKAGIKLDSLELACRLESLSPDAMRRFEKFWESETKTQVQQFPTGTVEDTERYLDRLCEQLKDDPDKLYEVRERLLRISRGNIDPKIWLREQYTNDDDRIFCQICRDEMPFRKRKDGKHYFMAVEILSKNYLSDKEREKQYLALCPLCAAKYKEFIKYSKTTPEQDKLKNDILNSNNNREIEISLGEISPDDKMPSIRFKDNHYLAIKLFLEHES